MIKFEYNGRIYAPENFEKKLKKLGITKDDVKILEDTTPKEETKTGKSPIRYFINKETLQCVVRGGLITEDNIVGLYEVLDYDLYKVFYNINDDDKKREYIEKHFKDFSI